MNSLMKGLAAEVWLAVEAGKPVVLTSRMIYQAALAQLLVDVGYDPETDHRMAYLRAVLADQRLGRKVQPDAALHATVGVLLELAEPVFSAGRGCAA